MFQNTDIGKLFLRLFLGFMILTHGYEKIQNGIYGVTNLVTGAGLPAFIAYGVYIGEVFAPILIILGLYARMASLLLAVNMVFAIFLAYGTNIFYLGKHGGPVIELPLFYLALALIVFVLGSGRYAANFK
ncbi:DoxX family protein [Sulfurimonas sp. SAG-AH-194-I05]|nr:DoxX family protein [Sulfurimonas sp. SAG-AH-194-I05]MDF1874972.1 DoxX family protein [Sulfurimonas sp. SAG-AH-194-I05]